MASTYSAEMPSVKTESGRKALNRGDPIIKVESDVAGATPETLSDGDVYEDAGDLDFARAEQGLYLTRIPISLWESWSNIDDDQEIQLGIIRVEGALNDIKRVCYSLALTPKCLAHKAILNPESR